MQPIRNKTCSLCNRQYLFQARNTTPLEPHLPPHSSTPSLCPNCHAFIESYSDKYRIQVGTFVTEIRQLLNISNLRFFRIIHVTPRMWRAFLANIKFDAKSKLRVWKGLISLNDALMLMLAQETARNAKANQQETWKRSLAIAERIEKMISRHTLNP